MAKAYGRGRYATGTYPEAPTPTVAPADLGKVLVSSADNLLDFLSAKLQAGANVTLTITNPGGNEKVEISVTIPAPDHKVLVDIADTTAGFLDDKLSPGSNITFTTINPGANEEIVIAAVVPPGSSDHKVLVDGADTTADFLAAKLAAGTGISFAVLNPGANEQVEISASAATPTLARANKGMAALTTAVDGDLACATGIAFTPATPSTNGGYIGVTINEDWYNPGDGTKVGVVCYFSDDGGATARNLVDVVSGDLLYWNQSVAGFNLSATTSTVGFHYPVTS